MNYFSNFNHYAITPMVITFIWFCSIAPQQIQEAFFRLNEHEVTIITQLSISHMLI